MYRLYLKNLDSQKPGIPLNMLPPLDSNAHTQITHGYYVLMVVFQTFPKSDFLARSPCCRELHQLFQYHSFPEKNVRQKKLDKKVQLDVTYRWRWRTVSYTEWVGRSAWEPVVESRLPSSTTKAVSVKLVSQLSWRAWLSVETHQWVMIHS